MKKCCFIGQDIGVEDKEEIKARIREAIVEMKREGVYRYQIGGKGTFIEVAMEVLTEKKQPTRLCVSRKF